MATTQPRYTKQEFARRGDAIYDRDILPHLEGSDEGRFVAIDIETGAYEVDASELAASDRLLARIPEAQMWLRRIGSEHVRHFGARPGSVGA
jgi:hypothetical protein